MQDTPDRPFPVRLTVFRTFSPLVFLVAFVTSGLACRPSNPQPPPTAPVPSAMAPLTWTRSELYFGMECPGGALVSDAQWEDFFEREAAPRFPAGMTVLPAAGRYRAADGHVVDEPSRILIILYPADDPHADGKIQALAAAYAQRFDQESVMRCDLPAVSTTFVTKAATDVDAAVAATE